MYLFCWCCVCVYINIYMCIHTYLRMSVVCVCVYGGINFVFKSGIFITCRVNAYLVLSIRK